MHLKFSLKRPLPDSRAVQAHDYSPTRPCDNYREKTPGLSRDKNQKKVYMVADKSRDNNFFKGGETEAHRRKRTQYEVTPEKLNIVEIKRRINAQRIKTTDQHTHCDVLYKLDGTRQKIKDMFLNAKIEEENAVKHPFHPQINMKSRMLVQKHGGDVVDRNTNWLNEKKDRVWKMQEEKYREEEKNVINPSRSVKTMPYRRPDDVDGLSTDRKSEKLMHLAKDSNRDRSAKFSPVSKHTIDKNTQTRTFLNKNNITQKDQYELLKARNTENRGQYVKPNHDDRSQKDVFERLTATKSKSNDKLPPYKDGHNYKGSQKAKYAEEQNNLNKERDALKSKKMESFSAKAPQKLKSIPDNGELGARRQASKSTKLEDFRNKQFADTLRTPFEKEVYNGRGPPVSNKQIIPRTKSQSKNLNTTAQEMYKHIDIKSVSRPTSSKDDKSVKNNSVSDKDVVAINKESKTSKKLKISNNKISNEPDFGKNEQELSFANGPEKFRKFERPDGRVSQHTDMKVLEKDLLLTSEAVNSMLVRNSNNRSQDRKSQPKESSHDQQSKNNTDDNTSGVKRSGQGKHVPIQDGSNFTPGSKFTTEINSLAPKVQKNLNHVPLENEFDSSTKDKKHTTMLNSLGSKTGHNFSNNLSKVNVVESNIHNDSFDDLVN